MVRARHEHQIKLLNTTVGQEFDKALWAVIRRNGLDFFADEQIAEIRAEMISTEWSRHKFRREQRHRVRAWVEAEQKEIA